MKRTISIVLAAAAAVMLSVSCDNGSKRLSPEGYTDFLYAGMPMPDSLVYARDYWEKIVAKTLETRDKMNWGIPEREFRHFVLPVRVNNENLDEFRLQYADELCERVSGLSLGDAILEINHWCHEKVTYTPTDARTRGPLALMASGKGRCGEESTFTVSALRAAGIPARQVYTPRWAHTDDNHAWVEAWVDGKWHFMGACEPEPALDMGWFNAPVSRALLLHTKVAGDYHGDEDVITKNPVYTEINVIRGYVPARNATVTVLHEDGTPAVGIQVEYKIFNYSEFYTACRNTTDEHGRTSLYTGLGDMLAWAGEGDCFGFAKLDRDNVTIVLNRHYGDVFECNLDIVPPAENPLPHNATDEQIAQNGIRLALEDSIRNAAHVIPAGQEILESFKASVADDPQKALAAETVLKYLMPKDRQEAILAVLEDAISNCDVIDRNVLSPRIEFEMLYPYKAEIRAGLEGKVSSPEEIISWMKENITVNDSRNPQKLRIPPVFIWRSRMSDTPSLRLFFVAACRSLGFPARLNHATGIAQYLAGDEWQDVTFGDSVSEDDAKGEIHFVYDGEKPEYFNDYTLAKIENGSAQLLDFEYSAPERNGDNIIVKEGWYLLTSGKRLPDGSVLAHISTFNVKGGEIADIPLKVRKPEEQTPEVIAHINSSKVCDKEKFILAIVKRNGEPTIHALKQLEGNPDAIIRTPDDEDYAELKKMIEKACGADPKYLPYVVVADASGKVYWFSQGYNTTIKESVDRVFPKIR